MQELDTLARQAVLDALALAGPGDDGTGFIRTAPPAAYLSGQRLTLAREALSVLRLGAPTADPDILSERFKPRLRELVLSGIIGKP